MATEPAMVSVKASEQQMEQIVKQLYDLDLPEVSTLVRRGMHSTGS